MQTRRLFGLVAFALAAAVVLAWGFRPRPVAVELATVTRGPLVVTVDEEGRTRVRDRFEVSAPVPGFVRRLSLEVGDPVEVKAGEFHLFRGAADAQAVPAGRQLDAETGLDFPQITVENTCKNTFPDKGVGDLLHFRGG